MEELKNKIRNLRKQKGLSQRQIAETAGISIAAYSNIESENKTKTITIEVGKGIAQALGVSFAELFDISYDTNFEDHKADLISRDRAIEDLKNTINELIEKIKDKDLLLEVLKNEKSYIKGHLVMQMVSSYSFDMDLINDLISRTKDEAEKEKLIENKKKIERLFSINKDYYFKTGFLSQADFDNHYKDMEGIYKNMPK